MVTLRLTTRNDVIHFGMPVQHPDRLLHLNREWCLQTDSGSTLCTLGRLQQSTPASLFIIHAEGTFLFNLIITRAGALAAPQ